MAVQLISKSASGLLGGDYMAVSYHDLMHPKPTETKTAEEIVNGLVEAGVINLTDNNREEE